MCTKYYTKYHGCGNDFIIGPYIEGIDNSALALKACERHTGIGADGLILAKQNGKRVEMVFYNADGTRSTMCGNGIRCFALYCLDNNLVNKDNFEIDTLAGVMHVEVKNRNPFQCKICLGKPDFSAKKLDINTSKDCFWGEKIKISDGREQEVYGVYMATHHLVAFVKDLKKELTSGLAEELRENPLFTKGINVNLVEIKNRKNIVMKTYERGAGWTLACGTGASAAFVVMRKLGFCDEAVSVHLELGTLQISINDKDEIMMEGPSVCVAKNIEIL